MKLAAESKRCKKHCLADAKGFYTVALWLRSQTCGN